MYNITRLHLLYCWQDNTNTENTHKTVLHPFSKLPYLKSTTRKLQDEIPKVFKEIFLVCIETLCFEFKY